MSDRAWIDTNPAGFKTLLMNMPDGLCRRAAVQVAANTGLDCDIVRAPSPTRVRYKVYTIPRRDGNYFRWKTYGGKHVLKPTGKHPLISALNSARV